MMMGKSVVSGWCVLSLVSSLCLGHVVAVGGPGGWRRVVIGGPRKSGRNAVRVGISALYAFISSFPIPLFYTPQIPTPDFFFVNTDRALHRNE